MTTVLELENISKHFGAIRALNDVSLTLNAGDVVGLVGDNGAGKSTLVKIIAGNFHPSEGTIKIVYQDLALADNLTAAANIFLGREKTNGFGVLDYKGMYQRAGELFTELK